MITIGNIQAARGEKVYGRLQAATTHADFAVDIPVHILHGARPGPVLLVQAGVSGLEIEPAMTLPELVAELDPGAMAGTLIVVPLLNTTGFEFEQRNAIWDDKDLNSQGRGRADGSISEQLIHHYFNAVISQADAVIDIHTGALSGYYRYAGVYDVGAVERSRALAVALGLPQTVIGQPLDQSPACAAAEDGKAVVSLWIGGGPGLRDFGAQDAASLRLAVYNALKALGILAGEPELPAAASQLLRLSAVIRAVGEQGLVFMNTALRGQCVRAGEPLGYVRHAFTGARLHDIVAPKTGVVVHAGSVWPVVRETEDTILAVLADPVE